MSTHCLVEVFISSNLEMPPRDPRLFNAISSTPTHKTDFMHSMINLMNEIYLRNGDLFFPQILGVILSQNTSSKNFLPLFLPFFLYIMF